MYLSLKDRVVVVSGASRGIGRASALELARAGARLALLARDQDALGAVREAAQGLGAEARVYPSDLRRPEEVERAAAALLADFGRVDALVNNAAVGRYGGFLDLSREDFAEMLDVNVLGVVALTQALLPAMLARGEGHVLMVASVQGLAATATSAAYSASKFALVGLTRSLALDVGPQGVRVTLLCPGSVATDFDGFPGRMKPLALTAEDVAQTIREMLETGGRAHLSEAVLVPFRS